MKLWKYPDEVDAFIREHYQGTPVRELAEMVSREFGIDFTYGKARAYLKNHGLKSGTPGGWPKGYSPKYPEGMDDFIRSIAEGKSSQELTDAVNEKYGEGTITVAHMRAYKKNHGIVTGLTGQFEKGHIPDNKGKTWDEYMSKEGQENARQTQFQPGHTPHNGGTPVGTVRLRHDHKDRGGRPYYWEKVAEPNVWRMKHVIEWEKVHGPVPDGCMVTFANGDSTDYSIGNLVLETRAQHGVKNRHNIHGYDLESELAANRIADLKMAVTAAKKRRRRKS